MIKKIFFVLISILFIFQNLLYSQEIKPDSIKKDTILKNALNVYLDYNNCYSCDFTFIRKEVNFVNYVRDPKESQLHIIIIQNSTGSGGYEFTFIINGNKEFKNIKDTIKHSTSVNNSDDENRREIVKILKMALVRFVIQTPIKNLIEMKFNIPDASNEKVVDKWKSWVFSINSSFYAGGEKSTKYVNVYSAISAKKITPDWKIRFNANNSYYDRLFIIDDTTKVKTYSRSYYVNYNTVKSINKHWSSGIFYSLTNSTYSNNKLTNSFSGGIEYDAFPYSESSSKLLTFRYQAGYEYHQYMDTTLYEKIKEGLWFQSIGSYLNLIKKWGSVSTGVSWNNYFYDFNKNNLSLNTSINIRILKGLYINGYAYVSLIHDQLSLPKSGATQQEILLQQKQLASQYSYNFNIGLTYTFGSIYNNIVNPRFDY